jgi:hypothetical protein
VSEDVRKNVANVRQTPFRSRDMENVRQLTSAIVEGNRQQQLEEEEEEPLYSTGLNLIVLEGAEFWEKAGQHNLAQEE